MLKRVSQTNRNTILGTLQRRLLLLCHQCSSYGSRKWLNSMILLAIKYRMWMVTLCHGQCRRRCTTCYKTIAAIDLFKTNFGIRIVASSSQRCWIEVSWPRVINISIVVTMVNDVITAKGISFYSWIGIAHHHGLAGRQNGHSSGLIKTGLSRVHVNACGHRADGQWEQSCLKNKYFEVEDKNPKDNIVIPP